MQCVECGLMFDWRGVGRPPRLCAPCRGRVRRQVDLEASAAWLAHRLAERPVSELVDVFGELPAVSVAALRDAVVAVLPPDRSTGPAAGRCV